MKSLIFSLVLISLCFACNDDDEDVSIVGTWRGDRMEGKVSYSLLTLYAEENEDYAGVITFNPDGTVIYKEDKVTTNGTYTVTGDQLTTDIDFGFYEVSGPVTFQIADLTKKKLRLTLEQTKDMSVPDVGEVAVTITGSIEFDR